MRQKVTWFIPGILLTLLMGLLWAMPAFAADAGTISFMDGDDEIDYISLNGLGGPGQAIMIQVEDQDLNEPATRSFPADTPTAGVDWSSVADANGDGLVNFNDFTGFFDIDPSTDRGGPVGDPDHNPEIDPNEMRDSNENTAAIPAGYLILNTQAGTLAVDFDVILPTVPVDSDGDGDIDTDDTPAEVNRIEYKLFTKDDISGRSATTEERSYTDSGSAGANRELLIPGVTHVNPPNPASYANRASATAWTWLDILDTNRDGQLTGADNGITVVPEDDRATTLRGGADNEGTISPSVLKAVNTSDDALQLTVEFSQDSFEAATDPADPPTTLSVVTVTVYGRAAVTADPTATPPIEAVTAIEVSADVALTYTVPTPAIGSSDNRVRVSTDAFPSGINVILTESAARSGKFQAMVEVCNSSMDSCEAGQADSTSATPLTDGKGLIKVPANAQGDTLRVTYSDSDPSRNRTASIPLDVDSPSFSNLAPDTGTAGREDEPTVSFDVQDTDSGLSEDKDDADSVYVLAGLYTINGDSLSETIAYERDDLKLEDATNGYSVSVSIEEGPADLDADASNAGSEYEIHWWAVSTDLAGNVGVSDSDGATKCTVPALDVTDSDGALTALDAGIGAAVGEPGDDDYAAGTGCDPFVVRVDAASPELDETMTFTGTWLDGAEEKSGSDAKRTSIVVAFSEALDCTTVSADDFEVDGAAPNGATCKDMYVYLDVDEMDPNDRPEIQVGNESLSDRAGNLIGDEDEITANDGIPAKLTVTVTGTAEGDRPITNEDITIMISSDERLAGNPTVTITKVFTGYLLQTDTSGTASPTGAVNEWSYTPIFGAADDDGLYNVHVSGNDLGSGALKLAATAGTAGVEDMVDGEGTGRFRHDPEGKSNILFEVDNEVQAPAFKPEESTSNAGAFVRADFADEGKEYGLSAVCSRTTPSFQVSPVNDDGTCDTGFTKVLTSQPTDTPGDVVTDFDTSSGVTLVSASFNGDDVTDDVITRDNVLYVYRPGSLTNGDHTFTIEVTDAAGNEGEFTHEFEKVDRPAYKIELNPGPNLISFPADPADGDVNAVFGGEADIMQVLTYDNDSQLWMTASRDSSGNLAGDLTTVNGMNGYWVVSDGVVDVSVVLQAGTDFQPPPHIAVTAGWNLIGVVDADQAAAGTKISAKDYFANIDAEVVYGYNSVAGLLDRLSVGDTSTDEVKTGAAYWVYANEAGIIVP